MKLALLFLRAFCHAKAAEHYLKLVDVMDQRIMTVKGSPEAWAIDERKRAASLQDHHAQKAIDLLNSLPGFLYG